MKVHEKIGTYLHEHQLKQDIVAKKSGIPYKTFIAMIRGEKTLYADDLRAICLALDVRPELFIEIKST